MEFLAAIEGIIAESRPLMSSVLRQQFPNPKTYTFRATLDNPQHLIPFPTLYGQDIQRFTGDQVSKWLADYQSQEHPGGEKVPKEVDHSTLIESVRHSWRVDLVHPEVDVGIRLVSVPSEWNVRLIGPTADLLSSQIPSSNERLPKQVARPAFPSTIRILLTIKANKSVPDVVRPGRTALSPVTAHLLTWVHPVFSPFHPHNTAKPALTDDNPQCGATPVFLDPCCGTGAIPLEIVNSAYHQGLGVFVLCGDLVTHNAKDTIGLMSGVTGESNFDVVRWDVACIGSPLRAGTVDGIVTDLPWGHREATPRMIEKLYPKFLKTFARMMTFGGYVVVLTSARPLFKRLVQGNKKWKEIPLGKEWHIDAEDDGSSTWPQREVWVGGMRASVFLLQRVEAE
ncbi:THUMP domain-containing protein 3 [Tulasnella sp. 419]|nr:THUMP domain-containing protein 3 [Tulasnella sp. 419]